LGAVTEKNILLEGAWDALSKVYAVRHANGKDIWIISRKYQEDKYASFLLTDEGVEDNPVLSYSPHRPANRMYGSIKVSYNKKYLIAAYRQASPVVETFARYDICQFNAETGEISFLFEIDPSLYNYNLTPSSIEFSPDSKLV
jgi:hypothetical protein